MTAKRPADTRRLGGGARIWATAVLLILAATSLLAQAGATGAPPTVLLTPNTGQQGQTLGITAQGLPCQGLVSLSFSPPGLTVSNLTCGPSAATLSNVPSSPTFSLAISPGAAPGPYTLTAVLYGGQRTLQFQAAFTVTPAPQAPAMPVFLTPGTGQQGQTLTVTAQNLPCTPRTRLSFLPPGLAVSNLQCGGGPPTGNIPTGATFTLSISAMAPPGPYTLVADDGGQTQRRYPAAFTVVPGVPPQGPPPRVDRVTPQDLEPGKTYTLQLFGFAFGPGMAAGFGPDLQNLTPPVVLDPQRAQLMVLVSSSALEGVRLAEARNTNGQSSRGPGGIRVVSAKAPSLVVAPVAGIKLPLAVVKPHGHIVLWSPNHQGSGEFKSVHMGDDPPLVQNGTQFTWWEENPGVARHFTLYIEDRDGKVLAQAETPSDKPYYRVTAPFLKSLPSGRDLPYFNWTPPAPPVRPSALASSSFFAPGGAASSAALPASSVSAPSQAQMDALLVSMGSAATTGLSAVELGGLLSTGHANATWRVSGFWTNPATGTDEEVETSDRYPLVLPAAPQGLGDCSKADQPEAVHAQAPGTSAVPLSGKPVTLSGTIDITRSPYPISVTLGGFGGGGGLVYSNLYISWGDGAVENLKVDVPPPKSRTIALLYDGKPLQHVYGHAGEFTIQIYASANPEKHDGAAPGVLLGSSLYSSAATLLLAGGGPGGTSPASGAPVVSMAAFTGVSSSGMPSAAPATMVMPAALLGADAYLVACTSIGVEEPEDEVASGPLHLKSIAVTSFPGHSETPPKVPDCSDSFTAKATLAYYGKGSIGVTWTVDGVDIPGSDQNIGPGRKTPPATVQLESPPLPAVLTGTAHDLKVRAWVIADGYGTSVGGGSGSGSGGGMGAGGGSGGTPVFTVLRPTALGLTGLGGMVSSASASSSTISSTSSAYSSASSAMLPLLISVSAGGDPPERSVASAPSSYDVVPHDPSKPCGIAFPTKDGDFKIGDLGSDFVLAPDGTASGSGKLHLKLPEGTSGTEDLFVPITFSGWHLSGSGDSRRVADGAVLDQDVSKDVSAVGLSGAVKHLKGTAGSSAPLEVTFHLGISAFAGLSPLSALQWDVKAPITPAGDFYTEGITLAQADLGLSGFKLEGAGLVLDLSRSQGSAPAGDPCSPAAAGTSWIGLYIKTGSLGLYAFNLPVSVSLPTPSVAGWAIGPSGLEGKIDTLPINATIPLGLGDLKIKTLDLSVCGSSLVAKYTLSVEKVPLINTNLDGTFQVDSHGNMATSFTVPSVALDFTVIGLKLFNADFKNEAGVGWRVAMDSHVKFKAGSADLYSFDLSGLRVTMDGKVALAGGAASVNLPLGGSAALGPVKIDIQQLQLLVGAESGHPYVGFNLSGGFHLSDVLAVSVSSLKYKLIDSGGGFTGSGPTVEKVKVHAQFPEVSPTVKLDVELGYKQKGSDWQFSGDGTLGIVDAGDISMAFLLGYKGSSSYWMARASIPLGASGIALFPPYLSLYQLQGGLGHNVPLTALSGTTPLSDITPTMDGSYAFMAGARLGSSDTGFLYTFDGLITIKTGGSDAGFRIDAKAWILTGEHTGSGQLHGFIQYAAGAFDAGLSADWTMLSGAVRITAPDGAVSLHFGGGDWHIYLGQNVDGKKLSAHVLVVDCHGYCMLDNTGLRVGGDTEYELKWSGSLWGFGAHVNAEAKVATEVAILFGPLHLSGDFTASASISGGLDTPVGCLCISLSAGVKLHGEAMPVKVCGEAWLDFGEICWCLVGCCDHYSVTVGPICV